MLAISPRACRRTGSEPSVTLSAICWDWSSTILIMRSSLLQLEHSSSHFRKFQDSQAAKDRILYSVDYPYTGLKFIEEVEASELMDKEELEMFCYKNAEKLLKVKVPQ